jgi:hypothetical protein
MASYIGRAAGLTIVSSIQLKSSTVRPTSSGWRATCSASAFPFAPASSSPSTMARSHSRGGGTSVALAAMEPVSRRFSISFGVQST